MSNNNMECKCDQKGLCSKMRNASIKKTIDEFEASRLETLSIGSVNLRLEGIKNTMEAYGCMPCRALARRVEWLIRNYREDNIYNKLDSSQLANLRALLEELKVFVS